MPQKNLKALMQEYVDIETREEEGNAKFGAALEKQIQYLDLNHTHADGIKVEVAMEALNSHEATQKIKEKIDKAQARKSEIEAEIIDAFESLGVKKMYGQFSVYINPNQTLLNKKLTFEHTSDGIIFY